MSKDNNYNNKKANLIGITAILMFSIMLAATISPSVSSEHNIKTTTAKKVLSNTHQNAVNTAKAIDEAEYERIATKEINVNTAQQDSTLSSHRIMNIINQDTDVIKIERQLNISGMNMGTNYDIYVDSKSLQNNSELNKAIQDYHDAIVFLEIDRQK